MTLSTIDPPRDVSSLSETNRFAVPTATGIAFSIVASVKTVDLHVRQDEIGRLEHNPFIRPMGPVGPLVMICAAIHITARST